MRSLINGVEEQQKLFLYGVEGKKLNKGKSIQNEEVPGMDKEKGHADPFIRSA